MYPTKNDMDYVPVFTYSYGKQFDYIPIKEIDDQKTLICVVNQDMDQDFRHILTTVHEYHRSTTTMNTHIVIRLLNAKLNLIAMTPNLCKDWGYDVPTITALVTDKIQEIAQFKY